MYDFGGKMSYPLTFKEMEIDQWVRGMRTLSLPVKIFFPIYNQQIIRGFIQSAIKYQRRLPLQ